jgi:hypothetical protein
MVKIVDHVAVSAGQRPVGPVVSARIQHALFERNGGFVRPVHALRLGCIGRRSITGPAFTVQPAAEDRRASPERPAYGGPL